MTWLIVAVVALGIISLVQFIMLCIQGDRLSNVCQVVEGLRDCTKKEMKWLDLADEDVNRAMDRANEALRIARETREHVDSRIGRN